MDNFDATLKRAFAEAPEPEDKGFVVRVSAGVAKRERAGLAWIVTQRVGFAAAGSAIALGAYQFVQSVAPQLMATFGLELARAHGALSENSFSMASLNMGVGLTQILLVAAALAGGAAAYRATQE
ncbi:MAG: hypothetical protein WDM79_05890 [Terricaulis sp.]